MLGKFLGSIVGLPSGVILEATGRTSIATGKIMVRGGTACLRGADRCYAIAGYDRDCVLAAMLRNVCKHLDGRSPASDLPAMSTAQWADAVTRCLGLDKVAELFETTSKNELALSEDLFVIVSGMVAEKRYWDEVKDAAGKAERPEPEPEAPTPTPPAPGEVHPDTPGDIPGGVGVC